MTVTEILTTLRQLLEPAAPSPTLLEHPDCTGRRVVALRDGYKLHDLAAPKEVRRKHRFTALRDFAAWLQRHAQPDVAEIGVGADRIHAIVRGLELRADCVTCDLVYHPTYLAWTSHLGKPLDQRTFHHLVRSQRGSIGEAQATELLGALMQLRVAENLECNLDEYGFTRFAGVSRNHEVQGRLSPTLVATTPVFTGVFGRVLTLEEGAAAKEVETAYELELLVSMVKGERGLLFTLDCPGLDLVRHQAREDLVAYVRSLLGDEWLVGQGELATEEVERPIA
jgi:hypothetical protein